MDNLTQLCQKLQLAFGPIASQLAFATGFRQRVSKLDGPALMRALVGGWLHNPQASRSELAAWAGVSKQALDQALNQSAAGFLKAMLEWLVGQVVTMPPASWPLLSRFAGVYVMDSSVVNLPPALAAEWQGLGDSRGATAALKLHVGLDLVSGALVGPTLTKARVNDAGGPHQNLSLPAGALRLSDLGYFKLGRLIELNAAGVYYVTKVLARLTFQLGAGPSQKLVSWLAQQTADQLDCEVGVGRHAELKCRLVAWRVPAQVLQKRLARQQAESHKRQRATSVVQVEASQWLVYLTNLTPTQASADEIAVLYRLRWQIELLFKLWKSWAGELEQWRSGKEWAIMCEVYAKLIGQLVQHWSEVVGVWEQPERSLVKASRVVRGWAVSVVSWASSGKGWLLEATLEQLKVDMQRCRLDRHKQQPSSYQLWAKPPHLSGCNLN